MTMAQWYEAYGAWLQAAFAREAEEAASAGRFFMDSEAALFKLRWENREPLEVGSLTFCKFTAQAGLSAEWQEFRSDHPEVSFLTAV